MLLTLLLLSVAFNLALFVPAYIFKTDKLTDISYALTFIALVAILVLTSPLSLHGIMLTVVIILWAIRLGGFLLIRIAKTGKDQRFDGRRENFFSFASFWLLQGVSVWVILLPAILFFENAQEQASLPLLAVIGAVVTLIGLSIETIADAQKFAFKNNPANKNSWIATGIWKYSRHPNYFGEILVWIGVYLIVLPSLTVSSALFALLSPLYITSLLLFVSGIPLLEKSADERWGKDPKYQEYKEVTSVLIPLPNKK